MDTGPMSPLCAIPLAEVSAVKVFLTWVEEEELRMVVMDLDIMLVQIMVALSSLAQWVIMALEFMIQLEAVGFSVDTQMAGGMASMESESMRSF